MTTGLPDFFHHNLWANLRLLNACADLSDAQLDATAQGTFGSIQETLLHLFDAEEGYVRALTGTSPTPRLEEHTTFPGFATLRQCAERSGQELIRVAEQGNLSQVLHLEGGTYNAPVIVILIQAINHAVDHRSQISTLLSQQGIDPPDLDGWSYNDALS
jgi:uncharacterized damage-inducible protein DinB